MESIDFVTANSAAVDAMLDGDFEIYEKITNDYLSSIVDGLVVERNLLFIQGWFENLKGQAKLFFSTDVFVAEFRERFMRLVEREMMYVIEPNLQDNKELENDWEELCVDMYEFFENGDPSLSWEGVALQLKLTLGIESAMRGLWWSNRQKATEIMGSHCRPSMITGDFLQAHQNWLSAMRLLRCNAEQMITESEMNRPLPVS